MAAPAPTYDLTLLLDSTADDDRRKKILADAQALIGQHGTVASTHDWGVRPTTYEVKKHAAAEYHLIQFSSPAPRPLLEELDRTLPITDGVLRYRIIKLKPGIGEVPNLKNATLEDAPASDDVEDER
ncbi:30S ribosomal protein S6 [Conexibacter sp. W3-3-2]|uniref:Small ribosomal subunit protein bS6 n=1 Tax=Paraconexibacter algicola TaxID=2133960 RepID=A0A2T4UJ57_9ACTN|nr:MULTISPECIES: 30S ribosomal protein S6 [Solirubrobacterales]MTD45611.1 30S ribosomal protein S6 [Conexibacter sp. W3-3-2]PTL59280.1 30S ribosomal protein S6 [Paraconexibacter algicola]